MAPLYFSNHLLIETHGNNYAILSVQVNPLTRWCWIPCLARFLPLSLKWSQVTHWNRVSWLQLCRHYWQIVIYHEIIMIITIYVGCNCNLVILVTDRVVMTTYGATCDHKVGIVMILSFQWSMVHLVKSIRFFCAIFCCSYTITSCGLRSAFTHIIQGLWGDRIVVPIPLKQYWMI